MNTIAEPVLNPENHLLTMLPTDRFAPDNEIHILECPDGVKGICPLVRKMLTDVSPEVQLSRNTALGLKSNGRAIGAVLSIPKNLPASVRVELANVLEQVAILHQ